MQRFQIKQSKKEYYTSHSGLALIGLALNRYTGLKKLRALAKRHGIPIMELIRTYGHLEKAWYLYLAQGKWGGQ